VISGYDMTAEAALTKLYYLFSRGYSPKRVKREMLRDLRGEMTSPHPLLRGDLSRGERSGRRSRTG
jgi:L-asparaginase